MSKHYRKFLLVGFLFFGLLSGLQAQEKYLFAIVRQMGNHEIVKTVEKRIVERQRLPKEFIDSNDNSYLFDKIAEMQDEGWEVYASNDHFNVDYGLITTFFLRKKKN